MKKKRVIPNTGWHYLINGRIIKVAWHELIKWKRGGWRVSSWFFSFRNRSGYSNTTNRFGHWYQVCILGLNIGIMYKIEE